MVLKRAIVGLGAVSILALAGVAGSAAGAAPAAQDTVTVDMLSGPTRFEPAEITIRPGTTVTWITRSGSHTTTSTTGLWDSVERLPVGESYSYTFNQPGVYPYVCTPHVDQGMVGRIIVSTAGKAMGSTGTVATP